VLTDNGRYRYTLRTIVSRINEINTRKILQRIVGTITTAISGENRSRCDICERESANIAINRLQGKKGAKNAGERDGAEDRFEDYHKVFSMPGSRRNRGNDDRCPTFSPTFSMSTRCSSMRLVYIFKRWFYSAEVVPNRARSFGACVRNRHLKKKITLQVSCLRPRDRWESASRGCDDPRKTVRARERHDSRVLFEWAIVTFMSRNYTFLRPWAAAFGIAFRSFETTTPRRPAFRASLPRSVPHHHRHSMIRHLPIVPCNNNKRK